MTQVMVAPGAAPVSVMCGLESVGATVTNEAGSTVSYAAAPNRVDTSPDGTLAVGANTTLYGQVWLYLAASPTARTTFVDVVPASSGVPVTTGAANVWTNNANNFKAFVTFGNTSLAGARNPFKASYAMGPHAGIGGDSIVYVNQAIITGDWSTDADGLDPGFVFGANDYIVTGTGATDATNINTMVARLIEGDVRAPNASITTLVGAQIETNFAQATAGGTVTNATSLLVIPMRRKDGAVAGTVTSNVYGLRILKANAALTGAANAYSIWVEGGMSFLKGALTVASEAVTPVPTFYVDGVANKAGFFTKATSVLAVGQQSLAAAATDLASVITLANSLRTGQINLGLGA